MKNLIPISEIFLSLQGEGPDAGRPALFIRLAGCNLRCKWCDSKYAWNTKEKGIRWYGAHELVSVINKHLAKQQWRRVVLTGGEPMMYQEKLLKVIQHCNIEFLEIETNGTIPISSAFYGLMYLKNTNYRYNVSPKLSNATPDILRRQLAPDYQKQNAIFKFVLPRKNFSKLVYEIKAIMANGFGITPSRIWIMPEGIDRESTVFDLEPLVNMCLKNQWNFSLRGQNVIWGGKRGV